MSNNATGAAPTDAAMLDLAASVRTENAKFTSNNPEQRDTNGRGDRTQGRDAETQPGSPVHAETQLSSSSHKNEEEVDDSAFLPNLNFSF